MINNMKWINNESKDKIIYRLTKKFYLPLFDDFKWTFVIEHGTIVVYNTQDYTSGGIETLETVSRDSITGLTDESGDGQINFKVILDEGYIIDSNAISPANYKNLKVVDADNNIFRITKVTGDITISVNTLSN